MEIRYRFPINKGGSCGNGNLSVLAAVSHSRIGRPSIVVKNISPTTAVGLMYNFRVSKKSSWTEPKIIFDYDRRVPARPLKLTLVLLNVWKYFRIILAVGFFGGFLVKSFVEDRIRKLDVKHILAFYHHWG